MKTRITRQFNEPLQTTKENRAFEKAHLKAYLKGSKVFRFKGKIHKVGQNYVMQ